MTAPADQPDLTTLFVSLPTEAITALQTAAELCGHSQAQAIYHAVRWWAWILQLQARGGQIYLRDPDGGGLHRVLFAAGSFDPAPANTSGAAVHPQTPGPASSPPCAAGPGPIDQLAN